MKPFRAVSSYFNGRYWGPNHNETVKASSWLVAIARAARRIKSSGVISRMKPGDKLTITIECLRPVKFTEEKSE